MRKNKVFLAFTVFALFALCVVNICSVRGVENSWTTVKPMLTERMGFGVAVVNGKIYAIGGWNAAEQYLNRNEEYDPVTDTWVTKEPMPTRRCYCAVAAWQNKIYVFGGHTSTTNATAKVEVYDPLTNSWNITPTAMPTARSGLSANVVNDRIYLLGGGSVAGKIVNTDEVYYPSSDSWTTAKPLPVAAMGYASAVVNGKIFVFHNKTTQIYTASTDTWIDGAKPSQPVFSSAAGTTTGTKAPTRIYILGGLDANAYAVVNLNQVYNPDLDSWATGTPITTPRYCLSVAVVDDLLYALGGFDTHAFATNERYTPFGYDIVPPTISTPVREPSGNASEYQNVTVRVDVTDLETGIRNVTLCYRINNDATETCLPMNQLSSITYQTTIPGHQNSTSVLYRIVAFDNSGNQATNDNQGYYYQYLVVPEFPSLIVLLSIMFTASTAVVFYSKKRKY